MTPIYKICSILLSYPEQEIKEAAPEILSMLNDAGLCSQDMRVLLKMLQQDDLITQQENYVMTFDRTPTHALHMFEHLHGEDRSRGQAMVDLLHEYQSAGFEPATNELPDYLPLFLEFLSQCEPEKARELLGEAVHVIAYIGGNLRKMQSPYAAVFDVLESLSPIAPQPLTVAPVRNMDEALEKFGVNEEGIEPSLALGRISDSMAQPVHFYANTQRCGGLKG